MIKMNSFALILKDKDLNIAQLNEFLLSIDSNCLISERKDFYQVSFDLNDLFLLKEAFESYLFDAESKIKVFIDSYESEIDLYDKIDCISKYFNSNLKESIYDTKTLIDELIYPNLSDLKALVLKEFANDYSMINLLKVYIENNMNVLKSSKLLYIHRNTLLNKLERFKEVTGYDPKEFKDAYIIYSLIK